MIAVEDLIQRQLFEIMFQANFSECFLERKLCGIFDKEGAEDLGKDFLLAIEESIYWTSTFNKFLLIFSFLHWFERLDSRIIPC